MARYFWDEMGRGDVKGMHGPMLDQLAAHFAIQPEVETTVPQSLALGNMMLALATNRAYAFLSVGALGKNKKTTPKHTTQKNKNLDRRGVPKKQSHYFALHAV